MSVCLSVQQVEYLFFVHRMGVIFFIITNTMFGSLSSIEVFIEQRAQFLLVPILVCTVHVPPKVLILAEMYALLHVYYRKCKPVR